MLNVQWRCTDSLSRLASGILFSGQSSREFTCKNFCLNKVTQTRNSILTRLAPHCRERRDASSVIQHTTHPFVRSSGWLSECYSVGTVQLDCPDSILPLQGMADAGHDRISLPWDAGTQGGVDLNLNWHSATPLVCWVILIALRPCYSLPKLFNNSHHFTGKNGVGIH